MELQHFSHQHPLVFNEDQQSQLQSETKKVQCSGCGDQLVSGPNFSCVDCKFYLHKRCAEAPSQMNHPFHQNHTLNLSVSSPYPADPARTYIICYFCNKIWDDHSFIYHCSCGLDFHIKCALLSFNIAEKGIAEFQHVPRIDQNHPDKNLEKTKCFACWKPLFDSPYFSPDCGFQLHVKCVDLPSQINHLCHPQHPLILQFNHQRLSCSICQNPQNRGFVYCCNSSSSSCNFVLHIECATMPTKKLLHRKHPLLLRVVDESLPCQICQQTQRNDEAVYFCSKCKFVLHSECASPPPVIEDKIHHDHPFVLRPKQVSLICDACGTSGDFIPYICSTCNIIVHKKCISLPRIIQFFRHHHPISHTYSLEEQGFETWECGHCYEEVNSEYGSYFCSKCNYIVHVNCALEQPYFYHEVDSLETDDATELSFQQVTDTSIKHISHDHNLTLSEEAEGCTTGDIQCEGCLLSISSISYYYCSQCDYFLHKSCAELPMKKHIWYHFLHRLLRLTWGCIFRCAICGYETSGFAYNCDECKERHCLPCALVSDVTRCKGHEHLLRFYQKCEGVCNACGGETKAAYSCKSCKFTLHNKCLIRFPLNAQHKCDEHPLQLTYQDKNSYSISHFCDICEDYRNPNLWFYHCATCDTSAHLNCVLGKFSFIKPGSICKLGDHPHPLTFVQKVHDYPECLKCYKPCTDLALECYEIGCSHIVHWKCVKPLIPFGETTTIKLLPEEEYTNN